MQHADDNNRARRARHGADWCDAMQSRQILVVPDIHSHSRSRDDDVADDANDAGVWSRVSTHVYVSRHALLSACCVHDVRVHVRWCQRVCRCAWRYHPHPHWCDERDHHSH